MINEIINSPDLWSFGFVEFILAAVLSAFAVYFFFEMEEASILVFFAAVAAYYTPSALLYIGVSAPWSFLTFLLIWFIEIVLFCIIWYAVWKFYSRGTPPPPPVPEPDPFEPKIGDKGIYCPNEDCNLFRNNGYYWSAEKADPQEEIEYGDTVCITGKRGIFYLVSKNPPDQNFA